MNSYTDLVRPALFRADPEWTHDMSIRLAEALGSLPLARRLVAARYTRRDPRLALEVAGLRFGSPIGLAAGYDKSGRGYPLLAALGFGHVEIGSVSADPSAGNPRPRLFRLPGEQAIVVHYGVPNDGAEAVAARLARHPVSVPLGVNVVNTNRGRAAEEDEDAILDDYVTAAALLTPHADYLCLNLSCPNTTDGRSFFTDQARLHRLLVGLADVRVPVILKVAPFPDVTALETFLETVDGFGIVSGFAVNLPPAARALPTGMVGAISGPPVEAVVNDTIRELFRRMDRDRYAIIGAGGVRSAGDAYRKIRLGASLVQVLTALIYEGPAVVSRITEGLAALLVRDGFSRVADAIGIDVPGP